MMSRFARFGFLLVLGNAAVAQPYPYNLLGRSDGAYDRGYVDGYAGRAAPASPSANPLSDYGRGRNSGDLDYWIDLDRQQNERARRDDLQRQFMRPDER